MNHDSCCIVCGILLNEEGKRVRLHCTDNSCPRYYAANDPRLRSLPPEPEKTCLCLDCRRLFTEKEVANVVCCPACGSEGIPADPRLVAALTLTHHEWRVLFMWAHFWAQKCDELSEKEGRPDAKSAARMVEGMIREVKRQEPRLPALTLDEEVQDCVNVHGARAEIYNGDKVTAFLPDQRKH